MSMYQGLDFSRFKKVASDNKTTTMRHSNGHEVKIVHSALSPKMRADIQALPIHVDPVKMAKGGEVKRKMYANQDEPVAADDNAPTAPDMDPASPATADDDQKQDMAAALQDANSQAAANPVAPSSYIPDETAAQTAVQPPVTLQGLQQEGANTLGDMQNGLIKPETYQSMFAKKDTLGKIGTLFGLIVGGAGAGLTHQPNMVMDMMNRELQNDLEAQKASKTNALNWFNAGTNLMTAKANADQVNANTTMANMRNALYHTLLGNAAKIPPGSPYQQQYMQQLQQLYPNIQAANTKNYAQAVLAANQGPDAQGQPFDGPVNGDLLSAGSLVAPEIYGPAQQEAARVNQTRTQFDNYTHAYGRLNDITAGQGSEALKTATDAVAGFIPFSTLPSSVAALAQNLQQEREAEKAAMPGVPEQFLPSGYDFLPGEDGARTRAEKANRAAAFFKLQEGYNPMLNMLQSRGQNVVKPQPYSDWAASMREGNQPRTAHVSLDSNGLHIHDNSPSGKK